MKNPPKKLQGGEKFDALLGKLAHVPKEAVDKASRAWKKARAAKKKPKPETPD